MALKHAWIYEETEYKLFCPHCDTEQDGEESYEGQIKQCHVCGKKYLCKEAL
jgi:hypothetical protein